MIIVAAMSGCASTPNEQRPAPGATSAQTLDSTMSIPGQQELNIIADAVQAIGRQDFVEVFAGVETDAANGRVVVYRVPSASFDRMIASRTDVRRIQVSDAQYSERRLLDLVERIKTREHDWQQAGMSVNLLGVRHDGACATVGTMTVEPFRRWLADRFPGEPICIEESGPAASWGG
ncbi:hypothetical protein [Dactylosporangium sp. NPDC005555]|uniref:hypothetical protein n=1 Tax=Dactylosporangium sp. NPDC005555 TaxID=3154889 RepID=UPI0033A868B0